MMNEIRAFSSDQFGEVRTVTINDEPWFVAADVTPGLLHVRRIAIQ